MKTVTSKSNWSDIINAAQEARDNYSAMLEKHPRVAANEQLYKNLELVATKQTINKEQAAMFVNEVVNTTINIKADAARMQEEFLNSEEGKLLTQEFEDKKNELYFRIVKINKEVVEKMNNHLSQYFSTDTLVIREDTFLNLFKSSVYVMLSTNGQTEDILRISFEHKSYDYTHYEVFYPNKITFNVMHVENEFEAGSFAAYKYTAIGKILCFSDKIAAAFKEIILKGIYEVDYQQNKAVELEYNYKQAITF